jgi:hypothetical protein
MNNNTASTTNLVWAPEYSPISLPNEGVSPLESGFPRFVSLKNGGEKVRVISVVSGSGFYDFVILKRNGEMFQVGITECIAPSDYVQFMFDQRDIPYYGGVTL